MNQCPADIWNKIIPENIKQETGVSYVHLNRPRYWMIDGMQNFGWKFPARILKSTGYLSSKNKLAVVIQDDYLNTYQQTNTNME